MTSRPFPNFPKTRSELPPAFQAIYADQYKENRDGGSKAAGLAQKLESWMHRRVAADVSGGTKKATLEIGAGTLNHLQYEPASEPYDVIEPFHSLFEGSAEAKRIRTVFDDIAEIPADTRYDRVISIAAFEHILDLPAVIARAALLLNEGGQIRCGIPSEGTVLWKLGYTVSTGMEFKKRYGLDYSVLMRHEHVNTAKEIEGVLKHFFKRTRSSVFGLAKPLSIYQFYECREPDLDRCRDYLSYYNS